MRKQSAADFHRVVTGATGQPEGPGHFIVYRSDGPDGSRTHSLPLQRRDFYKLSLVTKGEGVLTFADQAIHIKDRMLVFLNPMAMYAWEPVSSSHKGYSCLFTEQFLSNTMVGIAGDSRVLVPDAAGMKRLQWVFEQMLLEMDSNYVHKYELLRDYVQIVLHEGLKMEPPEKLRLSGSANARIYRLFMDALERQFPVTSPGARVQLKNAGEFAARLGIHPNHLNRVLREVTGSTTTAIISERILKEARALLRNTDWELADIAYSLGFEHSSNFIIFFRRHMGMTPARYRKQTVSI